MLGHGRAAAGRGPPAVPGFPREGRWPQRGRGCCRVRAVGTERGPRYPSSSQGSLRKARPWGPLRMYKDREDPSTATAASFGNMAGAGAIPCDSSLPSSVSGLEG